MKRKKSNRGGSRPGSGRKATIHARPVRVSLDAETIEKAREIGAGNLSAGVRLAVNHFPLILAPIQP